MNVLFLDIDGVVNSGRTAEAFKGFPYSFEPKCMAKFDHVALALLRRLCDETQTSIVLSSSWRIGKLWTPTVVANALDLPIFAFTPVHASGLRGEEIKAWLDGNDHQQFNVEHYAIVDDDSDMLPEQAPYFVRTKHLEGLSYQNYVDLKEILSGRPKQVAKEMHGKPVTTSEWYFNMNMDEAPLGGKLIVLNPGRVATFAVLTQANKKDFIGWAPMGKIPKE